MKWTVLMSALVLSGTLLAPCGAQDLKPRDPYLSEITRWYGKNGKSIEGVFTEEREGVIYVFDLAGKTTYKLRRETLRDDTLAWFVRAQQRSAAIRAKPAKQIPGAAKANAPGSPNAPAGFEPIAQADLDRSKIPALDQSKYGQKASDCVPNSYAAFFLWWDQRSNLEIPKGRDFDDKAEWIHKELARRFATRNNSGTKYAKLEDGIREYFERYHQGQASFDLQFEYDIRPANLARLTQGGAATVLALTIYHGDRIDGGHAVSLIDARADGSVTFNSWGMTLTGKIESLGAMDERERVPQQASPRERFEIKLGAGNAIPDWMSQKQVRFVLDPTQWDCLQILTPYRKTAKPPVE